MENNGFIKIHRKLLDWEYKDIPEAVSLWIYILLRANWQTTKWHDIEIKRGSFITSYDKLSKATGISVKKIRRFLKIFEMGKQIELKRTNRYTLISVVKYDTYQVLENNKGQAKGTLEGKQRASKGQQIKKNKKNKKYKEECSSLPTPTLEQVITYCNRRHSNINPTRFYNYYNQRNWLVSGKIIDWKLKVKDWEQIEYNNKPRVNKVPEYIQNQKQGKYKQGTKATKETLDKVKEMQGKGHGK